jgi:hypothetical protein
MGTTSIIKALTSTVAGVIRTCSALGGDWTGRGSARLDSLS